MSTSAIVLIVGAGPVGLTAAAHLHRHGVACRIVDRSPSPSKTSKALVLWPRSLETLDDLGIVDQFLNAGIFANAARLHGGGRLLLRVVLEEPDTKFPRPLMLAQSETERLLTEHLGRVGLQIERSTELISFVDHSDRVVAVLRHDGGHDEEFSCDWVIGCDGAHSSVRKGLSMEFTGQAEPNDWVLADCRLNGPIPDNEISLYWNAEGVLAIFPFAANRCRIIADMGSAGASGRPSDPTLAQMQAIVDRRGPRGVKLTDPIWLSGFRINERKVSHYRQGRIFLAGDAAHIHSPAGGQGMNTGMQDAYNLAWKLALVQSGRGKAEPLLDSYDIERNAVGEAVLRNASRLTKIATLRNPVGQYLRNRLVGIVGIVPALRRNFARNLSELSIHYPNSPLNEQPDEPSALQPGYRLPDALLRDPISLRERRLLSVTHGPGHNLLLFPKNVGHDAITAFKDLAIKTRSNYAGLILVHLILPEDAWGLTPLEGFDHVWHDSRGAIASSLGIVESTSVLVRPDGYVGYRYFSFRSRVDWWEDLRRHLDRYLISIKP